VLADDDYDISGAGTGVVNADAILGPDRVAAGDVLIAMGSSGLHSNGYSLVRHVLGVTGRRLSDTPGELSGRTVGEELLTPTRIYAQDCLHLIAGGGVHAFAHITGGGLAGNLARVLPAQLDATIDRGCWSPPAIFQYLAGIGHIARAELERTFNLGVGMVAVVDPDAAGSVLAALAARDVPSWRLGEVVEGSGQVRLHADYADCRF
jgi:phosphoribosylformylglycinamidine cyclo-ligase